MLNCGSKTLPMFQTLESAAPEKIKKLDLVLIMDLSRIITGFIDEFSVDLDRDPFRGLHLLQT
jgi:hypothetical protein